MQSPSSQIFLNLGFIKIRYYGAIMALSIGVGYLFTKLIARKYYKENVNLDILSGLFPIVTMFGLLGGRLYYVLFDYHYYIQHLNEIFAVWLGGLSIHGAILGGFISGVIYLRLKKE